MRSTTWTASPSKPGCAILFGAFVACADGRPFLCENDMQCADAAGTGQCETNSYCSTTDVQCPTGRRYTEYAGDGLAGLCVAAIPGDDGVGSSSSGGGEDSTGATDDSGNSSDTEDIAETAGSPMDPYGKCSEGCGWPDASCLESDQEGATFQMCSPPCSVENSPSTECPPPFGTDDYSVGCLSTGMDGPVSCFIECGPGMSCPNGMVCALGTVCSWQ